MSGDVKPDLHWVGWEVFNRRASKVSREGSDAWRIKIQIQKKKTKIRVPNPHLIY